jgi:GT2 family glycosyltransferase
MVTYRVSAVVATWNRAALARRLLAQLAAQAFPAGQLDIVVVDDGSTPPLTLPESLIPATRIKLIRQPNGGPARARDRGIREADTDLILLVDDDMEIGPNFVAAHVTLHEVATPRVVLGRIRPDPGLAHMPLFERFHAEMLDRFAADVDSRRLAVSGTHLCSGNVSFRRADYVAVGGFDPTLDRSEDAELGIRFEKAGLELFFSRQAFSTHRSDHSSLRVWMRRAYRYGINDRQIGWKHADMPGADPWRFLYLMNPLARPFLLVSAFLPGVGGVLAHLGMWTSIALDRIGLTGIALAGTTVVYGMQYFRGVRHTVGSARRTFSDWRSYAARLRAAENGAA